ncbi:MAG: NAD(P)-dependent alcohol dehydrogenase [Bacteroidia bacterium]
MKAFIKTQYGGPEILNLEEIDLAPLKENEIRVKILANSANPADWHILRGVPFAARFTTGLFKPKDKILGADFAGIVEKVGSKTKHFKVGDKVYGESLTGGAFAEYIHVDEECVALMPEEASFTEMACVPIAGLTALQAIDTHGMLKAGESVLINGASGGVGHFAVQIAKARGAQVSAVCSAKNKSFVESIGADEVIAYDQVDIHQHKGNYDLIIDANGNLNFDDYKRMGKRGVMIGFISIGHMIGVLFKKMLGSYPLVQFTAVANKTDLESLARLIEQKHIKVQIEKTYSYKQIPEAIAYIEAMRTKGKVAMSWEE